MALIDFEDDEERRRTQEPTSGLYARPDGDPPPPPSPPPTVSPPQTPDERKQSIVSNFITPDYRSILGRDPDANEIRSDYENYEKYGGEQLRANLRERAGPTSQRQFDSQSGLYDTITGELNPAGQQAASMAGLRNAMARAQAGGRFGAGRTTDATGLPGTQFSDPYTKLLEQISQQQIEQLKQPQTNPALDKLLGFLDTRFNELSGSPGYSPAEQALLRTQSLEPIEQDRAAAQRRSLERTAARGFLPSSGLAELDSREQDLAYDRLRGEAQRDLGINAINKRQQDLALATALGQLSGVQIPQIQRGEDQQRRNESIALSQLLYNLPRQAMFDNLAVVNSAQMPQNLFGESVQLMNAQNEQQRYNQQRNDAFMEQIGQIIAGLFK